MRLIRMMMKILLLPVSLVIFILCCVIKLTVRITSAPVGLFLIYVVACVIYCLFAKRWADMLILSGIGGCVILVLFLCILFDELLNGIKEKISEL